MPSVKLELGKYVTTRGPRKDGTFRVFFQVPRRLCPSGWLPLIPLPYTGARKGDLTDADEIGRIQADAKALYDRLTAARTSEEAAAKAIETLPARKAMPELIRLWQASQGFKGKKRVTQKGYVYHAGLIETWSEIAGHQPVASLKADKIETFLAMFDDRPTTRRHVKIVLKMLLDQALRLEWITVNPAATIRMKAPKSRVVIWEWSDVQRFAHAALWHGQPALAAIMLTQWEIGQRLTDVRLFRRSDSPLINAAEYDASQGMFRFWQEKTDSYVTIPVSDQLRALLEAVRVPDSPYLFVDAHDLQPYEEQRLGHLFIAIKKAVGEKRRYTIRGLRHSCVVQLARHEATNLEIASITGHSPASVDQILAVYAPRDNETAHNAQAKRGLVKKRKAARAVNKTGTEV